MALSASDAVTFAIDRSTPRPGIVLNEHYDGEGDIVYQIRPQARLRRHCVKAAGFAYRSGRVDHWIKVKNPRAPAVKREAEEDWGR
jgi:hypothetical protein